LAVAAAADAVALVPCRVFYVEVLVIILGGIKWRCGDNFSRDGFFVAALQIGL
jgi:hypothetical protein